MFDDMPERTYPDEGTEFYEDEFGERIETPASDEVLTEADVMGEGTEIANETEESMADESLEGMEPTTFHEKIIADEADTDAKIIEED